MNTAKRLRDLEVAAAATILSQFSYSNWLEAQSGLQVLVLTKARHQPKRVPQ